MLDKVILVSSLRTEQGTIKVAQWVKAPAIRPDELSSTPGTHMMEKEPTPEPSMWVHTHTHTQKSFFKKGQLDQARGCSPVFRMLAWHT